MRNLKGFLTSVFTSVALSTALMSSLANGDDQNNNNTPAPPATPPPAVVPVLNAPAVPAPAAPVQETQAEKDAKIIKRTVPAWEKILKSESYRFIDGVPEITTPSLKPVVALQLETSTLNVSPLLLRTDLQGPFMKERPLFIDSERHGESAARIIYNTTRNDKVDVRYIEHVGNLEPWVFDMNSTHARAMFFNADVISLSMIYHTWGNQSEAFSYGHINTEAEIKKADDFWRQSRTIFVQSAGNDSQELFGDLQRENALHTVRADTYLAVGEARDNGNGPFVVNYSSRVSDIACVAFNPFFEGFESRYVKNEEDLRREYDHFYSQTLRGEQKTSRDIFFDSLKTLKDDVLVARLQSCCPDFANTDFPNKKVLERDVKWLRAHPKQVLQAFVNGLIAGQKADIQQQIGENFANENGFATNREGTSFAGPVVGGIAADLRATFPTLSEYDVVSAMLIAAQPIEKADSAESRYFYTLPYVDNGRGIPFNSGTAGFGLLTKDNARQVASELTSMQWKNPALATVPAIAESGTVKFGAPGLLQEDPSYVDYKVDMPGGNQDVIALSTHLTLEFDLPAHDLPARITLISPSGGKINVSPTRLDMPWWAGSQKLSLSREIGHFGVHSAGTWTIRVYQPEHFKIPLTSAEITVKGMKPGNIVDAYLQQNGPLLPGEKPAANNNGANNGGAAPKLVAPALPPPRP